MPVYGNSRPPFIDIDGNPIQGGKLYIGLPDQDPVANPNPTVTDLDDNPIGAVLTLDDLGVPTIPFKIAGDFSQRVDDSTGTEIPSYQISRTGGFLQESDLVGVSGQGGDWNSSATYGKDDFVKGSDGEYYKSLTNNNLNNDPTVVTTSWSRLAWPTIFNINETYGEGDPVIASNGLLYTSADSLNTGNDPSLNGLFWVRDVWIPTITYILDSIVVASDGNRYIAITASSIGSDPISTPADWSRLASPTLYNANETYDIDDSAMGSDGVTYLSAINGNIGTDPVGDTSGDWTSGVPVLVNNDFLQGAEVGGAAVDLIGMNASDVVEVGDTSNAMTLANDGTIDVPNHGGDTVNLHKMTQRAVANIPIGGGLTSGFGINGGVNVGAGNYDVTLSAAVSPATDIAPLATCNTVAACNATCQVISTTVIRVRTFNAAGTATDAPFTIFVNDVGA
ncbi:MAG: hypothetical protein V3R25_09950 [Nitrosomonadaceae bacterium]